MAENKRLTELLRLGPVHVDTLAEQLSLDMPTLTTLLVEGELRRQYRRLPGHQYDLIHTPAKAL